MTDSIRTFIAIDVPPDAKEALATLTQTLKAAAFPASDGSTPSAST